MELYSEFNHEQDELLKTILNYRFFYPWQGLTSQAEHTDLAFDSNLEIYLTNQCNQKCSYCYLVKYPELYPSECTKPEIILKNLRILLTYIYDNHFRIPTVDLFSAEIWQTQFGLDILDLFLEYLQKGIQIKNIIIPTNGSFITTDKTLVPIQKRIDACKQYDCAIIFSISIDGKYIDNFGRERNNHTQYTDEFYERAFSFAKINNFYFHPMIAACNVHLWKENFDWWVTQFKYYNMSITNLMMLEVRNDDWTEQSIQNFIELLQYLLNFFFYDIAGGNIEQFGNAFACIRAEQTYPWQPDGYYPWILPMTDTFMGCTIATHLTIRAGDLAICPCHRTAYNKYLYGKFVVKNDKIIDIQAINPVMAIKVLMSNIHTGHHKCDTCIYDKVCLHGCLGSQIEAMGDPFFPIPSVCNFFYAKYSTILHYLEEKGIIAYYKTINPLEVGYDKVEFILTLYDKLLEEENHGKLGKC